MNAHAQLAIDALLATKSDDVYRLKSAFRNCTPETMKEVYGESGKTRQMLLDAAIAHDAKVDAAIAWVQSVSRT